MHGLLLRLLLLIGSSACAVSEIPRDPDRTALPEAWTLEFVGQDATGLLFEFRQDLRDDDSLHADFQARTGESDNTASHAAADLLRASYLVAVPPDAGLAFEILEEHWHELPWRLPESATDRDTTNHRRIENVPTRMDAGSPPAELSAPVLWHGLRICALDLRPYRWDPVREQIEAATRLRMKVRFDGDDFRNTRPPDCRVPLRAGRLVQPVLENPGFVEELSQHSRSEGGMTERYLVVAVEPILPYLDEWAVWKRSMGYEVEVATTEELGTGYSNWQAVRQRALELYSEPEGLDYILLVGDMLPEGGEFHLPGDLVPGGQYAEWEWGRNIVSDHSLALLEGDDYFADALVGRLPGSNINQLVTMLNRSIEYERNPEAVDTSWYHNALVVYDVAGAGSRRETSLAIRRRLLEAGWASVDTIRNHYIEAPVSPALVSSSVNSGVSLVNYRGFGFRDSWNGPLFDSQDALDLGNYRKWPLVTSIVCGGGDFATVYYDPCLGEGFLRAGTPTIPTGAVGFIGPSEEDTHARWNNCIDAGIYHGLLAEGIRSQGALMDRGKAEMWLCFPNEREQNWYEAGHPDQAQNVPFYFYCYNLLGDPGLLLRVAAPRPVVCAVPERVAAGSTQLLVAVADPGGYPVPSVTVAAVDAEGLPAGRTLSDEQGLAWLEILPAHGDTLRLAVTGGGIDPALFDLPVESAASCITLTDWEVDDQDPGNGNGAAEAGESMELDLVLVEYGQDGTGGDGRLELHAETDQAEIPQHQASLPATLPGETLVMEDAFQVNLVPSLLHGDRVPLRLELYAAEDTLTWQRRLVLDVSGPLLELGGITVQSGQLAPGEAVEVDLDLSLVNEFPLVECSARLYGLNTAAEIIQSDCDGLNVGIGETATCEGMVLSFAEGLMPGTVVPFELVVFAADGGTVSRLPFGITIGEQQLADPLGPDGWGYVIYHSGDESGEAPEFAWEDLSETGEEILVEDQGVAFNPEGIDGASAVIPLPFTFRFYGQEYDTITVCSNGWIAMGPQPEHIIGLNTGIPAAQGPDAMVAVFWTDLYNTYNNDRFGRLYQLYDPSEHVFKLQWNAHTHTGYPWNSNWFELDLRDPEFWPTPTGDGELLMYYNSIITDLGENLMTVGIEDPLQQSGLCYTFNGEYPAACQPIDDGTALRITTVDGWEETGLVSPTTPGGFRLLGAYPNPFNPSTQVRFRTEVPGVLRWAMYDLRGALVLSGERSARPAGEGRIRLDCARQASGLYLLRVSMDELGGATEERVLKLLLLK